MDLTTAQVSSLEEIVISVEAYTKNAAESLINVGRLLCDAREEFSANKEFGAWREKRKRAINPIFLFP